MVAHCASDAPVPKPQNTNRLSPATERRDDNAASGSVADDLLYRPAWNAPPCRGNGMTLLAFAMSHAVLASLSATYTASSLKPTM